MNDNYFLLFLNVLIEYNWLSINDLVQSDSKNLNILFKELNIREYCLISIS